MSMTDPIADFLTRIRNAIKARKTTVSMPSSKIKRNLATVLKQQGFINGFHLENAGSYQLLVLDLKYDENNKPAIVGLKRISKPGQRIYTRHDNIPNVRYNLGIAIITTSRGVMTDGEARQHKIGGEVICAVW